MGIRSRLASSALVLLLLGCASPGPGTSASAGEDSPRDNSSRNLLTQADLLETNETSVFEAVQRLRPQWLRTRSAGLSGPSTTQVFVNGSHRGEASVLRGIRVIDVIDVRFLSAPDAAVLFGTASAIGRAIVVRTGA